MKKSEIAKALLNEEIASYQLYVFSIEPMLEMNSFTAKVEFHSFEGDVELSVDIHDVDVAEKIRNNFDDYELKIYKNNMAVIYMNDKPLTYITLELLGK